MDDQFTLLPHLFRTEYRKLVAVLCNVFGLHNIEIAEDIVSDTFLLASETWSKKGLPDNQVAWLYAVSKNKARDHLRREKLRVQKIEPMLQRDNPISYQLDLDLSRENISDSQLRMLFAICHPTLKEPAQIVLALRVLCGFSIEEIAIALLTTKSNINKRLHRAKSHLRDQNTVLAFPQGKDLERRVGTVLTTIYLLFNEGYYSASSKNVLKKDFCLEAMRLTLLLLCAEEVNLPEVNALMSLMCFHASRFEARQDAEGHFILYDMQDREKWNQELMARGEYYLNQSSTGSNLSKYHLEAAIAYWHTKPDEDEKWDNILQLYNYLLQVKYTPVAALNRTYALARSKSFKVALIEALKLPLEGHHLYHCLLSELYPDLENKRLHLEQALRFSQSEGERKEIRQRLTLIK